MANILVEKATTIVEYSVDDSDPLNNDGTYLIVEGAVFHARPASEYIIYNSVVLPFGYVHTKFKYDGTTFTSNSDYVEPTQFEKFDTDGRPIGLFDIDADGKEIEIVLYA